MKKMKTSLAIAIAVAAGVTTSVFAQNVKEGTISFSLTAQRQVSVSETTAANAGDWVDPVTGRGPTHYKTGTAKLTQADLIKGIAYVLHDADAAYYGNTAKLVLVQGELSGFFNMTPDLSNSVPDSDFTGDVFPHNDNDGSTTIANSSDSLFTLLDSGRHFETNPITGDYPVGHLQPWGQIFVKYGPNLTNCENATEFFGITVQECYDCFYLNSYISDANFTFKTTPGSQSGPPCCSTPPSTALFGSGVDRYYVTLNFDNTVNNPYLGETALYSGFVGITPTVGATDGIIPDGIAYTNPIASHLGFSSPYEIRFTLDGILTYSWNLKLINNSDAYPDFVGNASLPVTGFGFIQLYCSLLTGTVTIAETTAKASLCCPEEDYISGYWADNWFSTGTYNDSWDNGTPLTPLNSNIYFWWEGYTPSTPFNTGANLSYHGNFNETYTPFITEHEYNPGT